MQERRATIRLIHGGFIHYAFPGPSDPRDGRLENISERGAGLLLQETPPSGEPLVVTFSLPGSRDWLTATGVVRWSGRVPKRRWCQAGLSWMPMEDEARLSLSRFLSHRAAADGNTASPLHIGSMAPAQRAAAQPSRILTAISVGLVWLLASGLAWTLIQLSVLAQRRVSLQEDLGLAQAHVASTMEEIARLDQQAEQLERQTRQFNMDVQQFQVSHLALEVERDQLKQRVLQLEASSQPSLRMVSQEALDRAVRETIAMRRDHRVHEPTAQSDGP